MPQQQKVKGGRKLRRCSRHQGQYQQQFLRTAANKKRQALRRMRKREYWKALFKEEPILRDQARNIERNNP